MAYTEIDKPSDYFNTVLYTGNASASRAITGVGFQPDWLWVKGRSTAYYHALWDVVRTNKSALYSNVTNAEDTGTGGTLGSFNSDGFTLPNESGGFVNNNGTTYVSWAWKAGTAFSNDASATSVGSIDSTGSVSTAAGFSIISYTGNNTGGATIAHGLGVTPNVLIIKNRDDGSQAHWAVYHHKAFVSAADPNILYLQDTAAQADDTNIRHSTATTNSTVFSVGDYNGVNGSGDAIIAYCFAEKQGYSKFGSYTGNGNADGPFVYTGFKPAFILQKNTARAGSGWGMFDTTRTPTNVSKGMLIASSTAVEDTSDAARVDFLSNGFKWRTTDNWFNDSGAATIYMAFAENPFVTSTGVPATAR